MLLEQRLHRVEHPRRGPIRFEEMTALAGGSLVGHGVVPQINLGVKLQTEQLEFGVQ
jgi:hypothetical protein